MVNTTATTNYLPPDILENILLRLPVKSLLRFGAVCKQWNATISDPEFASTHLRLAKKSSYLLRLRGGVNIRAEIVDLKNHEFRLLSTVDDPPVVSHESILSHCDGLYIIRHSNDVYALWNPSRRSYKKLDRYSFNPADNLICGICYDPSVNDYKIVIGDENHYAIFYHRNNSWSDLKESHRDLRTLFFFELEYSVTLHGSIYWVCLSRISFRYEIVCFDGEDEKLKILGGLDVHITSAQLIHTVDDVGLYIFILTSNEVGGSLLMMKKEVGEDEWAESKVDMPVNEGGGVLFWPVCGSRDDGIVFCHRDQYLLYDVATRCFSTLENSTSSQFAYGDLFLM